MAKKSNNPNQNTSSATTNAFNKGLNKDIADSFVPEGTWNHARNLVNNSNLGDLGVVGNEPSNFLCIDLTYTQIGAISVLEDYWVVFSTNNVVSEIGLFKENTCEYYIISRDPSWGFVEGNLIIGQAKENFDCSFQVYWADGKNPDRTLNIGDVRLGNYPNTLNNEPWPGVPYVCVDTIPGPCENCIPTLPLTIDQERTRLASIMKIPCITIQKGLNGGQLPNGSYYATIAYSINQQRVTDYFNPSQIQPLFSHENLQASLDINFSNLDTDNFNEFELVVVSTINQQTVARIIGYYNTQTNAVSLDNINPELETVPINYIPLRSPAYEKSEAMYAVNNYLIRVAPTGRFDFNYQPLANQIITNWVMVEYPPDYYEKGGNLNGYMRDEQYCFWIRWVYDTGERSSSYHIPGRVAQPWEQASYGGGADNIEVIQDSAYDTKVWEVVNTAYAEFIGPEISNNDASLIIGNVVARGKMGYWESTETYPADKPLVWNASEHSWSGTTLPEFDLCGLPIRHHKMPSDILYASDTQLVDQNSSLNFSRVRVGNPVAGTPYIKGLPKAIRILTVDFENIKAPVDNNGNIIPGIVGYEILRSNRQGNRTILAKGIINNMRGYLQDGTSGELILYPNYTCNYLGTDPSLMLTENPASPGLSGYSKRHFTFHSPDTNFENPYLSATELKLYGELGNTQNILGRFTVAPGHPKEKLLTNTAFILTTVLSIGYAAKAVKGTRLLSYKQPITFNAGINAPAAGLVSTGWFPTGLDVASSAYNSAYNSLINLGGTLSSGQDNATNTYVNAMNAASTSLGLLGGGFGAIQDFSIEESEYQSLPNTLKVLMGFPTFAFYWSTSIDTLLDLIRALVPYRDYVYRSLSEVDLSRNRRGQVILGNTRRLIFDSTYLESGLTYLGNQQVNNLFRSKSVGLFIANNDIANPGVTDTSVQTIGTVINETNAVNNGITWRNPTEGSYRTTGICYYAGLKVRYRNQYGQIDSPKQITTGCVQLIYDGQPIPSNLSVDNISQVVVNQTPVTYGGDVYIGQYAEKNTFFYFYDWLYNVMDGTEFDYTLRYMINYPRYYADFFKYDSSTFLEQLNNNLFDGNPLGAIQDSLPNAQYNLDASNLSQFTSNILPFGIGIRLGVKNAYMYLWQSAIRHFFVESEYNVDHRDYGELPEERIYDPYGFKDLNTLFDTLIIKIGNYIKYDISLGLSKVFNSFISWGNLQDRAYDPYVAEKCFTYFRNRVIYSLPQTREDKKDYWRVFLVNNYNDFEDRVTAFKPINKNGAIILFEHSTPLMFNAVDQLQTVAGTKITIGDGGLFSQPLQTLSNADTSFQHGACQDRLSVINTPAGIYWMSASQGKVFTAAENLIAISDMGMKWWFSKYLKFFILDQFPDFELVNNPVAGVGCQSLYDNDNNILYFCKKDYRVKPEYLDSAEYSDSNIFYITQPGGNRVKVVLGDPLYFDDVSWTVSFDTKIKTWLSFHDWHPIYTMSAIKGFLTTIKDNQGSSVWKHISITNSFCNFYGVDYPFEIDYISNTGQQVNTVRSVEYLLEAFVYDQDGIDRYQILDYNFDEAVVYNSEQVSGLLKLNLSPKNNAPIIVNYPQVNFADIAILYSKEEQKIRFNQFWDITNDRGEFAVGGLLVQQPIWSTELNGYVRSLNANNLNYNKSPFERKKFRHYVNHIVLTKLISSNVKLLFKIVNTKLLNSPR